jgi:uncharacterized membrane protein YfcA
MTLAWAAGAAVICFACFVMGLTGFGIAIVAMAFLPWLMSPVTAVVMLTLYAFVFLIFIVAPLRNEVELPAIGHLLVGTVVGVPLGVWALAVLPVPILNRILGLVLLAVVAVEISGRMPKAPPGGAWGLAAGFASGIVGGAVGTPGPPVIVYAMMRGWTPRTMKANIGGYLVVNQLVTLAGFWWAGLVTRDVVTLTMSYAVPGLAGTVAGMMLFGRIDARRFRLIVSALLLVSGLLLVIRG